MDERPESVTVIGWILIVFGGLAYLSGLFIWSMRDLPQMQQAMAVSRVSFPVMLWVLYLGTTVRILCAVALLRRVDWARYLFVVWDVTMLAYAYWSSPYHWFLIGNVIFTVVVVVFLFRPAANHWFTGKTAA